MHQISLDWSKHIHTQYIVRTVTHINSTGTKCRMGTGYPEWKSKSPGDSLLSLLLTVLVGFVLDVPQKRDDLLHVTASTNHIAARPHEMCTEKSINRTKLKRGTKRAGAKFAANGSPITKPSLRYLQSNDLAHGRQVSPELQIANTGGVGKGIEGGNWERHLSNSWSESSMPTRSRRLLSERSGASAGSLTAAPRLPLLDLAFAFPPADIAGAQARDRRLASPRACVRALQTLGVELS